MFPEQEKRPLDEMGPNDYQDIITILDSGHFIQSNRLLVQYFPNSP